MSEANGMSSTDTGNTPDFGDGLLSGVFPKLLLLFFLPFCGVVPGVSKANGTSSIDVGDMSDFEDGFFSGVLGPFALEAGDDLAFLDFNASDDGFSSVVLSAFPVDFGDGPGLALFDSFLEDFGDGLSSVVLDDLPSGDERGWLRDPLAEGISLSFGVGTSLGTVEERFLVDFLVESSLDWLDFLVDLLFFTRDISEDGGKKESPCDCEIGGNIVRLVLSRKGKAR